MTPLLESQAAYALFDGLFEKALLGYLSGDARGRARLAERVRWLLPQICPAHRSPEPPEVPTAPRAPLVARILAA